MTTKVLIVNHGPDPILLRIVDYGPDIKALGMAANVIDDRILHPTQSTEAYVHTNQQLLIGEKRVSAEGKTGGNNG